MTQRPRMLEILFGPIASGKSTYARQRAEAGALIANDDAIVMAVHGGFYAGYDKKWKPLYKSIRNGIIHHAAMIDCDVVVDSTGLKRSTRDFLRLLGRQLDFEVGLTFLRNGVFKGREDGRRRFKADPRGMSEDEWVKIAEFHAKVVDPVTSDEEASFQFRKRIRWHQPRKTAHA